MASISFAGNPTGQPPKTPSNFHTKAGGGTSSYSLKPPHHTHFSNRTPPPAHGAHRAEVDPWLTGWLSLAQLVGWGSTFYAFSMLAAPVEQALGWSRAEASIGFSLALLAEGLGAFAVGRWIDRGFARRVMVGGSTLAGVALVALSQTSSWAGWLAGWLVLGLAMAATLYTPTFAVLTLMHPTHFRRHIISVTFLGGLASTVFIPLMAWLLQHLSWSAVFLVLAGCQWLVCVPIHWRVLRYLPTQPQANLPTQPTNLRSGRTPANATYRAAMRLPAFWLVGVFVVLTMSVTVAVAAHQVNLLTESGLPAAWAIWLPACVGLVQVAGRAMLFAWERHASVHQVNRWIPVFMPLGLLALLAALGVVHQWPQAALGLAAGFVLLYGLGNGLVTIVKGTAIAQYVSQRHAASLNGALGIPIALARAAAPAWLGWLWSPESGYRMGLWILWGCCVVGWLALWSAQRLHSEPPTD